ncbi:MAG: hypothetical protein ACKOBZ_08295 [Nitrospira sp.]|nr:hypothetical protein [Nitrospira sp.]
MSWLTKRVQTARLRGKKKVKRAKQMLLRVRWRVDVFVPSRFLSGARLPQDRWPALYEGRAS